jgi:hypothetical protein
MLQLSAAALPIHLRYSYSLFQPETVVACPVLSLFLTVKIMATQELVLKNHITRLLSTEFGEAGMVTCPDEQVTVIISRNSCEQNYGNILQQIHRVIDEYCPDRSENVFILVRDETGSFKNVLKIWKSA